MKFHVPPNKSAPKEDFFSDTKFRLLRPGKFDQTLLHQLPRPWNVNCQFRIKELRSIPLLGSWGLFCSRDEDLRTDLAFRIFLASGRFMSAVRSSTYLYFYHVLLSDTYLRRCPVEQIQSHFIGIPLHWNLSLYTITTTLQTLDLVLHYSLLVYKSIVLASKASVMM